MQEELIPDIEELERAVDVNDARAAATVLHRLSDKTIYSENEVYDRLRAVEGKLAVTLFEGLEPAEFGKLIGGNKNLHDYRSWDALEGIADRVTAEALWAIKDFLKLPSPHVCPKLYSKLVESDDPRISMELIDAIDRLAPGQLAEGASLSAHQRTMSAFSIRWSPDDKGLSDRVRILAARGDDVARSASSRYLLELPWGGDRQATVALLDGLCVTHATENHELFKQALSVHQGPAELRAWLWGAIGESNPNECLFGLLADLNAADNHADRITFVDYLGSALSSTGVQPIEWDRAPIVAAAERVDTKAWSRIARGYYAVMLQTQLPEADVDRVSEGIDRAAIVMTGTWEAVRLDHMGCLIPLALMIGMGFLFSFGLDRLIGEPERARWLPAVLFSAWIAWSVVNVRTHFSGHETIARKVRTAAVYFALLLASAIAAVAVRIP